MRSAVERDRAESLATYRLVDGDGPDLGGVVALAARSCAAPSAAVGFLSESLFELHTSVGCTFDAVPRHQALSTHVVESGSDVVLADVLATLGPEHPATWAQHRSAAYAGVPLVGRDGLAIGALVVTDVVPRPFAPGQLDALHTLADAVVATLELGRLDEWGGRGQVDRHLGPVRVREALDAGELVPFFHPVVDLADGSLRGFEALLRWAHPELGVVAPGRFLPTVEASGLMLPVGRHVLTESLGELAALRRGEPVLAADVRMAVNASPLELTHQGYAEVVLDELAMQGLHPDALMVEVTETASFVDERAALRQLCALREAGVAIALDDYGAGHASVLRVLRLPLTTIKLDRALVDGLATDPRARAVARSTIAMATELGLGVVGEGIETPQQRAALLAMGCRSGQGWLFGRPVPAARIAGCLQPRVPVQHRVTYPAGLPLRRVG